MQYTNSHNLQNNLQTLACHKVKKNTIKTRPPITFDISEKEIEERKQRTKEFIGSLYLENIKLNEKTLADINYFDSHGITPENALAALYDELNKKMASVIKPP